ncbi:hypothetical protein JCM11251_006900 [Rhodosporidiobolus azoricus]
MFAPTNGAPKPPRLKIDKKYGGENAQAKYKVLSDFRKMHRAHWWTRGYDVKVSHENNTECRLVCATHGFSCPYNAVAEFTHFPELNASGYRIKAETFHPRHSHDPPYVPMDPTAENARRSRLAHDDPSLENPPLVPAPATGLARSTSSGGRDGFAREGSTATSVQGGGGGGGGGVYYLPNGMQQQHQQQGSYGSLAMTQGQAVPSSLQSGGAAPAPSNANGFDGSYSTPQPQQQQQQQLYQPRASYPSADVPQQGSMLPPAVPYQPPQQHYAPPPTPQQQQYGYLQQQQQTPASSSIFGTPAPPPSASSSSIRGGPAPQVSNGAANAHLRNTPLGAFLLAISPSFANHLHLFEAHSEVIPLSTLPSELLDLDTPTDPTDRAIFDTFKDVPGLPPFMVALAADGVRKARKRRDRAQAQGQWIEGQSKEDGRIAVGLEKAKAEKWVKEKIRQGEAILAQRAAAQQQQQQQPMQGVQVGL